MSRKTNVNELFRTANKIVDLKRVIRKKIRLMAADSEGVSEMALLRALIHCLIDELAMDPEDELLEEKEEDPEEEFDFDDGMKIFEDFIKELMGGEHE